MCERGEHELLSISLYLSRMNSKDMTSGNDREEWEDPSVDGMRF